jgi:hypothetical protein
MLYKFFGARAFEVHKIQIDATGMLLRLLLLWHWRR